VAEGEERDLVLQDIEEPTELGPPHGECKGSIVRVDINRRRPLYHVLYGDGDEEDLDNAELHYALDLNAALTSGAKMPAQDNDDKGMYACTFVLCF
jgi:hypothetical protein